MICQLATISFQQLRQTVESALVQQVSQEHIATRIHIDAVSRLNARDLGIGTLGAEVE